MTNNTIVTVTPANERNGVKIIPLINAIIERIEDELNWFNQDPDLYYSSAQLTYDHIKYIAEQLNDVEQSSLIDAMMVPESISHEVCKTFHRNGYDARICYFYENKERYFYYIEVALPGHFSLQNDEKSVSNYDYVQAS